MDRKLYQHIASALDAMANCERLGNVEWRARHRATIEAFVDSYMPSGSGIDAGTKFDFDTSKPNRLVFLTSYHHTDESGGYDGWTDYKVIVTADLSFGFYLRITGRDRNQIKDYLADMFTYALRREITRAEYDAVCEYTHS